MRRQWSEHAAQFWVISHYFYGASGKVLRRLGHVSGLLPTECMPWFGNTSRTFTKLNVAMIWNYISCWGFILSELFFYFHSTVGSYIYKIIHNDWCVVCPDLEIRHGPLRNWMLPWFCTTLRNDWMYVPCWGYILSELFSISIRPEKLIYEIECCHDFVPRYGTIECIPCWVGWVEYRFLWKSQNG